MPNRWKKLLPFLFHDQLEGSIRKLVPLLLLGVFPFSSSSHARLASPRTIQGNFDWADNLTLFTHDIRSSPKSIMLLRNLSIACFEESLNKKDGSIGDKELLLKSISLSAKILEQCPERTGIRSIQAPAYSKLSFFDQAISA